MLRHGWTSKAKLSESNQKQNTHILKFHWYEIIRRDNSRDPEKKAVVPSGWGRESGIDGKEAQVNFRGDGNGLKVPYGGDGTTQFIFFKKIFELYTSIGSSLYYVNYAPARL